MDYNLLDEQWIPVLYRDGRWERVGIRKAFHDAALIRQIAASNPMDNVALLRFLLAVLQWCKPKLSDDDRARLHGTDRIPVEWLIENLGPMGRSNKVFNLLGDGERFMQASVAADRDRPVADLYHELPGGSNKAHFRHIRDYQEGACLACIAIGLVRLPVAITGKGRGKRPGINGDPPMYFVPVGRTLLETLTLNWPFPEVTGDQPCWLKDRRLTQGRIGIMEGFTWTSRQFRISDEGVKPGTCMVCGADTGHLVNRLKELNKPNGRDGLNRCDASRWRDAHIIYDEKDKPWQAEDAEKNLPGSSGQWRDWLAGLFVGNNNGLQRPQGVTSVAERFDGRVSVLAAGIAMQGQDKAVESCACSCSISSSDSTVPANLWLLDDAVDRLIDPHVTLKGKKLARFKANHPLRTIRHEERGLADSVRAALVDRVPALEATIFENLQSDNSVAVGTPQHVLAAADWRSKISDVAKATTAGSPLRRREAMERAVSTMDQALRRIGANRERRPSAVDNAQANEAQPAKSVRRRRTRETGT
jgi:CRISPR type I-E-associated protein CasA/Cse1